MTATAMSALRDALLAWIDAAGTAAIAAGDTPHRLAERIYVPLDEAASVIEAAADRHAAQTGVHVVEQARAAVSAVFDRLGAAPPTETPAHPVAEHEAGHG